MTNQKRWPIGTKVKFHYDDLTGQGIIITDKGDTVVVCLDVGIRGGWEIRYTYDDPTRKYWGRLGWNVPYSKLERCETKLGNIL